MRWMLVGLLLGACSGDALWTACDGVSAACGDGYVCVPLAHEPLTEPAGYYCARGCEPRDPPEAVDADCEGFATEDTFAVCRSLGGRDAPMYCSVHGCEIDADCPSGLRCAITSVEGDPGTCQP
jgi:hypothetical protein